MKTFAVMIESVSNMVERRQPYRPEHVARLMKMKEEGAVWLAGAWVEPVDGALLVLRAESLAEAQKMVEDDVYHKNGLWPKVTIREWNVLIQ